VEDIHIFFSHFKKFLLEKMLTNCTIQIFTNERCRSSIFIMDKIRLQCKYFKNFKHLNCTNLNRIHPISVECCTQQSGLAVDTKVEVTKWTWPWQLLVLLVVGLLVFGSLVYWWFTSTGKLKNRRHEF
jgi:hypothetical protein